MIYQPHIHEVSSKQIDKLSLTTADMRTAVKVLRYVAKESMKDTDFGKQIASDIYPTISTELIVICDFWDQVIRMKSK